MDSTEARLCYAAIVVVAFSTLPSIVRQCKSASWKVKEAENRIYEDEDGVATVDSMAAYSVKKPFIVVLLCTGLALSLSFALAIFVSFNNKKKEISGPARIQSWLLFTAWVLTRLQQCCICTC
jgi:hypothetical protein